jgi:hypothetical protein
VKFSQFRAQSKRRMSQLLPAAVPALIFAAWVAPQPMAALAEVPSPTTVEQVLTQPETFQGTTATVSGFVTDVVDPLQGPFDPMAFTLASESASAQTPGMGMNASGLLVLRPPAALLATPSMNLTANQHVSVTGPVVVFNVAEIEQATGLDLDDQALQRFNGKPALVAMDVSAAPTTLDQAETPAADETTERVPMNYVGQVMNIGGTVLDPIDLTDANMPATAFTMVTQELTGEMPGARAILVIGGPIAQAARSSAPLHRGQVVNVTGPVVVLDVNELQRTTGLVVNSDALREWSGEPVLIATSVVAQP